MWWKQAVKVNVAGTMQKITVMGQYVNMEIAVVRCRVESHIHSHSSVRYRLFYYHILSLQPASNASPYRRYVEMLLILEIEPSFFFFIVCFFTYPSLLLHKSSHCYAVFYKRDASMQAVRHIQYAKRWSSQGNATVCLLSFMAWCHESLSHCLSERRYRP